MDDPLMYLSRLLNAFVRMALYICYLSKLLDLFVNIALTPSWPGMVASLRSSWLKLTQTVEVKPPNFCPFPSWPSSSSSSNSDSSDIFRIRSEEENVRIWSILLLRIWHPSYWEFHLPCRNDIWYHHWCLNRLHLMWRSVRELETHQYWLECPPWLIFFFKAENPERFYTWQR